MKTFETNLAQATLTDSGRAAGQALETHETLPHVSVIIPAFNRLDLIAAAVHSALDQQGEINVEVVLVDDASDDDVWSVVRSLDVRYCRLEKNSGSSVARNRGAQIAQGRYVKFLDSDDLLVAGSLAAEYATANDADADIVVCGWVVTQLSAGGAETVERKFTAPIFAVVEDDLLNGLSVPTSAAMYRTSLARAVQWNPKLSKLNDWDYFVRAALAADKVVSADVHAYHWRQHEMARITSSSSQYKHVQEFYTVLDGLADCLSERGALTERRRLRLAQYFYKELRCLYRHAPEDGRRRLEMIKHLDSAFAPHDEEPSKLFRVLGRWLPLPAVLAAYGALRRAAPVDRAVGA